MDRPQIQKQSTWIREPLQARTKLEITLRYLASGDSLTSSQYTCSENDDLFFVEFLYEILGIAL